MKKTTILLADDHQVVRMGLEAIIAAEGDMQLVGEASDGSEAVALARELRPDVILMDLMMPVKNGAEATKEILAENPGAMVVVLTTFGESDETVQAVKAGVRGALIKDTPRTELVAAIRKVAAGERVLSPEIEHVLAVQSEKPQLSPRQAEILRHIADGLTSKAIAEKIGISTDGVNGHIRAIFAHLGAASRTEAVAIALRRGLLG
jgi:DNA-binding NarL/FixJ family response regulator